MQLLAAPPFRSGSAWLGRSQKDGPPAGRGVTEHLRFKAIDARERGSPVAAPLNGAGMDAKALDLAFLAALSLLCAMFAWAGDSGVVGFLFFALGVVAIVGAGYAHQR